ncbi:transcription factor bHLH114-like [Eucalyptus grandis]|uniref:transcription factor bHLH114-like n=1 Tax=Eucalyptus grandis TaxID=71139 RepID=UPI00192EB796|nr:transcription factor bHLH114-like [Eucalyptus grandis]
MSNSFLPSLQSELFTIGNEFRMSNLEVSSLLDNKMNVHSNGGFYLQSKAFNDDYWLRDEDNVAIPAQPLNDLQTGYEYIISRCDTIYEQPRKKFLVPQTPNDLQANHNERKHQLNGKEFVSGEGFSVPQLESMPLNEWNKNKRKRTLSNEEHHEVQNGSVKAQRCRMQIPVRRSQKIGDKITSLQKLVSPYGKTDTASVLQEASLYIKLLQEQIQNLFQMLSSSYSSVRALQPQPCIDVEVNGEREIDLRSRGLCLVPVSSVQEKSKEIRAEAHSRIYQGSW